MTQHDVKVPVLAESVSEARILAWHKEIGDVVQRGDSLVDIETDKVTLEVPAPDAGRIVEILKRTGDDVTSGELLARLGETADTVPPPVPSPRSASPAPPSSGVQDVAADDRPAPHGEAGEERVPRMSPAVRAMIEEYGLDPVSIPVSGERLTKMDVLEYLESRQASGEPGEAAPDDFDASGETQVIDLPTQVLVRPAPSPPPTRPSAPSSRAEARARPPAESSVPVRPAASAESRSMAAPPPRPPAPARPSAPPAAGLPPRPSAPPPRPSAPSAAAPPPRPSAPSAAPSSQASKPARLQAVAPGSGKSDSAVPEPGRAERRERMSMLRKRIAQRLVQAQQQNALLTTFNEVNVQPVIQLRKRYREEFEKRYGVRLGFMSLFTKAAVEALRQFPVVNALIDGDDIVYHEYYDIGIAVSTERGLVVPVLRDADGMSLAEIESHIRTAGEKAREGTLSMEEITGGTFTITNGGVFGSLLSTPIVNSPQSAILGMHRIQERPMAEDGQVVIRPMMYLALSYDHRLIDGADAVQFLVFVKEQLEDPTRLLLQI